MPQIAWAGSGAGQKTPALAFSGLSHWISITEPSVSTSGESLTL